MKPRTNGGAPRAAQRTKSFQDQGGPNWVLIAGGALFSTLSIRLGYKLKQALDAKQADTTGSDLKGNGKSSDRKRSGRRHVQSNGYCFSHDDNGFNYISGATQGVVVDHLKQQQQHPESELAALPLVTVPAPEFNSKECGGGGVLWASSPDRLEPPQQKPYLHHHQSNSCSDSPSCVSESGSADIYSKREVIQKLRQQLKRRDDMILEMQDQILDLQNSISAQAAHSTHVQSLLDASNRDLFDSEREIQRLRKAIADHCVGLAVSPSEERNGYESSSSEKLRGEGDRRIEMLKREVGDLKEVIEGKEYLLQSYKEQKVELSTKIKELQQRLDSQLPNIL